MSIDIAFGLAIYASVLFAAATAWLCHGAPKYSRGYGKPYAQLVIAAFACPLLYWGMFVTDSAVVQDVLMAVLVLAWLTVSLGVPRYCAFDPQA